MAISIKLPDGTIVECSTAEEAAARFLQQTGGTPRCPACGQPHFGMC